MAKTTVGAKNKAAADIRNTEVLGAVANMTLESVTNGLTNTQVEVQKTLATVSAKITEQLQELRTIEDSITLKQEELDQLYNVKVTVTTLDDLHAQIETTRLQWEEEEKLQKRKAEEMRSDRQKQWARVEEEYQYKLSQDHRKLEDTFALRMAQQERDNKEHQDELEKNWSTRESELKKHEQELVDLRTFKENNNELIKKEVNAAVAISTNSVKKEYETKMLLAGKDAEMAQKLAAQEATSFQATIVKLNAQIDDIRAQLEQSHRDVKEISSKALDSASGRSAMEALQKVLEKDQPSKPNK
jgi:hypothetical protein